MYSNSRVVAVIGAAGSGKRMAASVPKQFIKQQGRTILETTVSKFTDCDFVDEVMAVVPPDYVDGCRKLLPGVRIIPGGEERQDSIFAAIRQLDREDPEGDTIVLIHDGVRPFVTQDTIRAVTEKAFEKGAAIAAVHTKDTIRHIDEGTLDRSKLYNVQTPQGFRLSLIREAYEKAFAEKYYGTDDAGLVERMGVVPEVVIGGEENIKITTPRDLRREMRVGTGYDVHRLDPGRKLVLGGVLIPWNKGLLGHSDADVLTHALMDAMLGAAALGDIGKWFPDSSPKYEGISSIILLKKVASLLNDESYELVNADVTVICQEPKLAGYIQAMRENIAKATGVDMAVISVKATTTEKLGFTGRGEGIAAEAICLIGEVPRSRKPGTEA
nr:2-C-methyl-D-erythritol 2,4-cyclodiphosphate synthase [Aminicella lysinilytica]